MAGLLVLFVAMAACTLPASAGSSPPVLASADLASTGHARVMPAAPGLSDPGLSDPGFGGFTPVGQTGTDSTPPLDDAEPAGAQVDDVAGISDGLSEVAVSSEAVDRAVAEVASAALGVVDGRRTVLELEPSLDELVRQQNDFGIQLEDASERLGLVEKRVPSVKRSLQSLAVAEYVRTGSADDLVNQIDSVDRLEAVRKKRTVSAVQVAVRGLADRLDETLGSTRREVELLAAVQQTSRVDLQGVLERRRAGIEQLTTSLDGLPDSIDRHAEARAQADVVGADFDLVVLDTYWRAAAAMVEEDPGCGIPWRLIAGVGWIESKHGTFGGSTVTRNGQTQGILGRVLDGEEGVLEILDTDGGVLDGDTEYDKAVGPMQFIPETWSRLGRDGNGDGTADPENLYDAAAAAADYLCGSENLATPAGQTAALLRYNRSDAYGVEVRSKAREYETVDVPPPPSLDELWPSTTEPSDP